MNTFLCVIVFCFLLVLADLQEEKATDPCVPILYSAHNDPHFKTSVFVSARLPTTDCPDAYRSYLSVYVDLGGDYAMGMAGSTGNVVVPERLTCNKYTVLIKTYDYNFQVIGISNSTIIYNVSDTGKVENLMCYTNANGQVMCTWARPAKCVDFADTLKYKVIFYNGSEVKQETDVITTEYTFSTTSCTESWFIVGPIKDDGTVTDWAESKVCA